MNNEWMIFIILTWFFLFQIHHFLFINCAGSLDIDILEADESSHFYIVDRYENIFCHIIYIYIYLQINTNTVDIGGNAMTPENCLKSNSYIIKCSLVWREGGGGC